MTQSSTSKASIVAALGKLIAGIQAHQATGVFLVDGKTLTAAQTVTVLQSIINALNAVIAAHGALKEAVATADSVSSENQDLVRDLRLNIQMLYSQSASILTDYGLAPRKGATLTPAQLLARAARAKATRAARNTMGTKQKAKITGTSVPVTTSPAAGGATTTTGVTGIVGSTGSSGTATGH